MYMPYSCPFCLGAIIQSGEKLECVECNRTFVTKYDIPVLTANEKFYYGEIDRQKMTALITRSCEVGWELAFKEFLGQLDPAYAQVLLNYAIDESRAGWKYLLDMGPHSRVLDFGCGWGGISISIARTAKEVFSMDLTIERLAFIKERARCLGFSNIRFVCGGDTPLLPFPDQSFDLIVLNGVLEWVPESRGGDPREVQLALLKEVSRVLVPNGQIYIGIENRISYRYIMGQREDHTGLRFAALLPRRLSNLYSKILRQKPYRTYTYSIFGYKKILREAGFKAVTFFAPIADYKVFEHIVDLSLKTPSNFYYKIANIRQFIKAILLNYTNITKYFCTSFSIVGFRDIERQRFIDRVVSFCRKLCETDKDWTYGKVIRVRKTNTVIIELVRLKDEIKMYKGMIVRIPIEQSAKERVFRNYQGLEYIQHCPEISDTLRQVVPLPLAYDIIDGNIFSVESKLKGLPGAFMRTRTDSFSRLSDEAVSWLSQLHHETCRINKLSEEQFNRLVKVKFERLAEIVNDEPDKEMIKGILKYITDCLIDQPIAIVFAHGDFWMGNFLFDIDSNKLTGVIDFDRSDKSGFPYLDLLHFLIYNRCEFYKEDFVESYSRIVLSKNLNVAEKGQIDMYLSKFELPKSYLWPLSILYVVDHTMGHLQKYKGFNTQWLEVNCFLLLRKLYKEIIENRDKGDVK